MPDLFTSQFRGRPAYRAACDALVGLGYDRNNIHGGFEIPVSRTEHRWAIDGVAFVDRIAQAQNAGVTIFELSAPNLREEEAIARLRHTTAPFHLLFNELQGRFLLWAAGPNNPIRLSEPLSPDNLAVGMKDFSRDLRPETVRRVKHGLDSFQHPLLAELNPLQLTLWAEEANGRLLTLHFAHVLKALQRAGLKDRDDQGKIAAQLLAARILIDTGAMQACETVGEIPEAADAKHFKGYFDSTLLQCHRKRIQEAYDVLKQISLATFQPEMLRDLYKGLFGKKETKARGRFDTPLWLTRRIWQNIPVEFLRPENRITADLTCGWGSFLIAGEERLSDMADTGERRLSGYIFGNDNDATTAELARVALLAATAKDSWVISHDDARRWQPPRGRTPNIIVGNPPFSGDRKTQSLETTGGKRHELANEFLSRAVELLAPGGFLAMVMPGSFVASEAGPHARKQLLDACDIFEMWDLPTGIFDDATVQPMVIFAQKIAGKSCPSAHPVRIRNLQKQDPLIRRFKETGQFTHSSIASSQTGWTSGYRDSENVRTTHVYNYPTILTEKEWASITGHSVFLSQCARIVNGCIRGNPSRNGLKIAKPQKVGWLTRPARTIPSELRIDYSEATSIRYPNDLEWPRYEDRDAFQSPKILIVSDPNPSWGKRVKIAIERKGYFVSESFYVIASRQERPILPPEVLAAVLRWKICNAWVLERLRYPKINKWVLDTMPFPKSILSSPSEWGKLSSAFLRFERAAQKSKVDDAAEQEMDDILRRAYGLNDEQLWERLVTVYNWDSASNSRVSLDNSSQAKLADWVVQGTVLDINAEREEISLWLNSFDEPQIVPIVPAMPGWLLRPNTSFITKLPASEVRAGALNESVWGRFEPEQFTYFSRAEAAQAINATLKRRQEVLV